MSPFKHYYSSGFEPSAGYPANQILALDANNVSGTTWTDLTGNGNDFTLVGSPAFNGSVGGGALEFEGTKYAEISSGLGKFDVAEWTLHIWFYYTGLETHQGLWSYDFTSHASPTFYAQHCRISSNNIFNHWNNAGTWGGLGISDTLSPAVVGEWMLWSQSIKTGGSRVFKNGAQRGATLGDTFSVQYYDQEVWIGRLNFDSTSNIKVAKVDFFDEALTPTEVSDYYDTHKSRFGLS